MENGGTTALSFFHYPLCTISEISHFGKLFHRPPVSRGGGDFQFLVDKALADRTVENADL